MMRNHKMIDISRAVLVVAMLLLSGALSSASAQQPLRTDLPTQDPSLYVTDPQPLTLIQCAQCHTVHFGDLQQAGGKHQFDCRECHAVFHAYNPRKNNYVEIMPKCATCHVPPHGTQHIQCLNCHDNPHAPLQVPMTEDLAGICASCHGEQAGQLLGAPSQHSQQECSSCHHDRHGYIPSCAECHDPHFEAQEMATCTQCHDVHQPLDISLSDTIDLRTCAVCHDAVYAKWSATPSKHGKVSCASCHNRHGLIPECTDCHTPPPSHAERLLEKFPKCLTCHLDVHDLPVKKNR